MEEDLPAMRKGDKVRVLLAPRLRRETAMNLKWIARRLHMGSWTYVSNLLYEKREKSICVNTEQPTRGTVGRTGTGSTPVRQSQMSNV